MLRSLKLYFRLISIAIRSQMQHRASFFMLAFSHFLSTFVDILGMWVLFDRFKMIQGWTLPEVALIYGIIHMGFAFSEAAARGFDTFDQVVKRGDFDRILLRPCGTILQIASREFQMMRIGRFLQGFVVLLWACGTLGISLLSVQGWIIAMAFIGASALFYALFVIQATIAFWTTETLEMMNITTYGGVETGQYPISIYPETFRVFLTFVIPLACVAYYPVAIMLKHETLPLWTAALYPLAGIVFLFLAFRLWHFGVRHYHSTGS